MPVNQRTIKNEISISGVGLHTGNSSKLTFKPAEENYGIRFKRIDLKNSVEVPADIDNVVDISRGTTIAVNGTEVKTVEHVLAAVTGCEIDNLCIELTTNEPPVIDGSAKPFVDLLMKAEFAEQSKPKEFLVIDHVVQYHNDELEVDIAALPLDDFKVTVMIDYNNQALGSQHTSLFSLPREFASQFAPARTFCFLHEVEDLAAQGLIKGGNLDNAVVIVDRPISQEEVLELMKKVGLKDTVFVGENGILNNHELRFKNEPARHKLLDLIGDMALIGSPIKAHIMAARPGHKSNIEFVRMLRRLHNENKLKIKQDVSSKQEVVMDINAIMKFLPHRYPFLMVDKIVEYIPGKRIVGVKNVTINEQFFQGHFPQKPVMPGVLVIEAMAQTGGLLMMNSEFAEGKIAYFTSIDKAKFRKMVLPGDQLYIVAELIDVRRNIFKFHAKAFKNSVNGELAAEADLMAALADG